LIDGNSLAGTVAAYLTGAAVTSAPWLLTTTVLVAMRMIAPSHASTGEFAVVERILVATYAVTLVASAPIHVVLSRYVADRLYEQRPGAIAQPLRRVLAATMLGFSILGLIAMGVLQPPTPLAWLVPILAVLVGAQWLLLGVGGGLSSPGSVLGAFGVGAVVSIAASFVLAREGQLGARGCLYGFAAGQVVTLIGMLLGVLRALPAAEESAEDAPLWSAFREYRLLALSAVLFHISVWADKVMLWLLAGRDRASLYTSASALAWFSVIPTFAWVYVETETGFYRAFRSFYQALEHGGGLDELGLGAARLRREAARILRGAAVLQLAVTLLFLAASARIVAKAGLPPEAVVPFRLVVVGGAPQMIALLGMLLLYYFDLRREAFQVACTHLIACFALTAVAWAIGLPDGAGLVAAAALTMTMTLVLVRGRMQRLVVETFQSQPYKTELHDEPPDPITGALRSARTPRGRTPPG
jgi:uncharacterized membrane protein